MKKNNWAKVAISSFFPNLWHSQTGDHPQEDLAKFGYIRDVKVKNFKNPNILLLPTGPCYRKIRQLIFFLESGDLGPFFSKIHFCVLNCI